MLHILLTILKVIGIIVLIILALLVILILVILFAPMRYRVHVRREDSPPEADGLITWILKILRVNAVYRDKKGLVEIRVLRFRIKSIQIPAGHGTESFEEPVSAPAAGDTPLEKADREAVPDSVTEHRRQTPDSPSREKADPGKTVPDQTVQKTSQDKNRTQSSHTEDSDSAQMEKKAEEKKPSALRTFLDALPEKAVRVVEKICDLLLKLIDLPFDLYDKADDSIDRVEKKIRAIYRKAEPFLSVEAEHMLRKLLRYLMYLIEGWKPGRVEGYLEFGTGAPDVTGKLTGLIYLFLPGSADRFDLRPDFYEKVFRTNVTVSGKIRLYRAAVVAVKLILDKEFWALIRLIRHKPAKANKKRKKVSGN